MQALRNLPGHGDLLFRHSSIALSIALALGAAATAHATVGDISTPGLSTPEVTAVTQAHTDNRQIIFVDSAVADYQILLDGIGPDAEIHVLDERQDGVKRMAEVLGRYRNVPAIHLIAHGGEARVQLGSASLDTATLAREYPNEMRILRQALAEQGDLLLHSCNTGRGEAGREFVDALAEITGADVAASDDVTGNANMGGDWELEVQAGEISRHALFDPQARASWPHVLGLSTFDGVGGATNFEDYTEADNGDGVTMTVTFLGDNASVFASGGGGGASGDGFGAGAVCRPAWSPLASVPPYPSALSCILSSMRRRIPAATSSW